MITIHDAIDNDKFLYVGETGRIEQTKDKNIGVYAIMDESYSFSMYARTEYGDLSQFTKRNSKNLFVKKQSYNLIVLV